MALFDKFASMTAQYDAAEAARANPFSVGFDRMLSPTEAMVGNRRVLLLGTNNYLGPDL